MKYMRVKKRNGSTEDVSFDKVIKRIQTLCEMEPVLEYIEPIEIAQKVCLHIYDGVHTSELDELAAELCTQKSVSNMEYGTLASRIIISNNQKCTSPSFSETIGILYHNDGGSPLISKEVYQFVMENKNKLNDSIQYSRDYNYDYFAFKTLEKSYLLRVNGKIVERIQHMFMRVSCGLHYDNIKQCIETYDLLSQKYFTHATPTLFHSGTPNPQLLSCFLLGVEDSVQGIYKAVSDCALISKWAGGIGLHIHDIRAENSPIESTNGKSNGLVPMLKVFNDVARHINQSGKRNGSFAMYLEPHHPDVLGFLEAKKNHGDENARARDLFYAMWISDLFMERVKNNEIWSLMCPNRCKGLSDVYGEDYKTLYRRYESDPKNIVKQIPAMDIWKEICKSQMETGTPYICYKDSVNKKSNQQHYGTIKSSNLCAEIQEYSDSKEYACCTLASISLPSFIEEFDKSTIESIEVYSKSNCKFCDYSKKFLSSQGLVYKEIVLDSPEERGEFFEKLNANSCEGDSCSINDIRFKSVPQIFINGTHVGGFSELYKYFKPTYNYKKLAEIMKVVTNNLNKVIDLNYYPVPETKLSNLRHRPIGIGVQGLADVYARYHVAFDSDEAKEINKKIFATIYYAALQKSNELAIEHRDNVLEVQMNPNYKPSVPVFHEEVSSRSYPGAYSTFAGSPMSKGLFQFDLWDIEPVTEVDGYTLDWNTLRESIVKYGIRNSLLTASMPTASTSQILGNNECIEPFTSNMYSRGTLAGQFIVINKYLLDDLNKIGLWSDDLKDTIIINNGSIQMLKEIPDVIRDTYKISWDLSMKSLIDQSADRGAYICQTQSLNLWIEDPDINRLTSMHFYSWKKGLKTGIYYLRRRAVSKAQTFSIDASKTVDRNKKVDLEEEGCLSCSA